MSWMAGRIRGSVIIMEPRGIEGNWTGDPESELLVLPLQLGRVLGASSSSSERSASDHHVAAQ